MKYNHPDEAAPNFLLIGLGVLLVVVSLLISIAVIPMLLFARDSRDMMGGIAGGVLILSMGLAGIFLILRQNAPLKLQKAFYYLFGLVAIGTGVGTIVMAIYSMNQGGTNGLNRSVFSLPVLMVGLGLFWIRQGYSIGPAESSNEVSAESAE